MREKGQTEVAKTLETPVFSRGIEILTEKIKFLKQFGTRTATAICELYPVQLDEFDRKLRMTKIIRNTLEPFQIVVTSSCRDLKILHIL